MTVTVYLFLFAFYHLSFQTSSPSQEPPGPFKPAPPGPPRFGVQPSHRREANETRCERGDTFWLIREARAAQQKPKNGVKVSCMDCGLHREGSPNESKISKGGDSLVIIILYLFWR